MDFFDRLTLDAPRRTADGYMVASVKVARTGIQDYSGREVDPKNEHGMRDKAIVRIYRDEAEVFSKDALASFAHRPVTVDHPSEAVTADNWRKYSVGMTGDEVARDGDYVRVPLALMDGAAIAAVEGGKKEISQGYSCDLDWTPGRTKDGLEYDATQRNVRGNHTAIVDRARGGPELKIGDAANMKTILIDGHSVEVSDAAEILVKALQTKLETTDKALATANTQVGTLTAAVSTKDGEIAALKTQVADSALTPAKLDAAVAARAVVVDAAKKIMPAIVVDGKADSAIRKEAVLSKIPTATTMDDNAILGAFTALSATIGDSTDTMRDGLRGNTATVTGDKAAQDARAAMIADMITPAKAA